MENKGAMKKYIEILTEPSNLMEQTFHPSFGLFASVNWLIGKGVQLSSTTMKSLSMLEKSYN